MFRRALITSMLLVIIAFNAQCQTPLWVKAFIADDRCFVLDVVVDDFGSVYATGSFKTTVDFDPGPDEYLLNSNGGTDIFIVKLDTDGNLIWALSFGGSGAGSEEGFAIALDEDRNVYVTGFYRELTDFDPGAGTALLDSNAGTNDGFVVKFDSDGNFVWVGAVGSSHDDNCIGIISDLNGHIFVTGDFSETCNFAFPSSSLTLVSGGVQDPFVIKLTTQGEPVWLRQFSGTDFGWGKDIACDESGNVYVTGDFSGTIDFGNEGDGWLETASGEKDAFVVKLDSEGNTIWVETIQVTLDDYRTEGQCIDIAPNGDVICTATSYGNVMVEFGDDTVVYDFNYGSDNFIYKLNSDGQWLWANHYGADAWDYPWRIDCDDNGRIYTTGTFGDVMDFDASDGMLEETSAGSTDGYLLTLNDDGTTQWVLTVGGTGQDYTYGIDVNPEGTVYCTGGFFRGSADFGYGDQEFIVSDGGTDNRNGYIAKYIPYVPDAVDEVTTPSIRIFPNPSAGTFQMTMPETIGNTTIRVYNILGEAISFNSRNAGQQMLQIELETSPGVYYIELFSDDQSLGRYPVVVR